MSLSFNWIEFLNESHDKSSLRRKNKILQILKGSASVAVVAILQRGLKILRQMILALQSPARRHLELLSLLCSSKGKKD